MRREHQLIDAFVGRRVDGLIVVSSGADTAALQAEIRRGTPVVFVDIEPDLADVDVVRSDHFEGARAATNHLLTIGHTKIAYLGDNPSLFSAKLRLDGFYRAMASAGIDVPSERIATGSHTENDWKAIAIDLLRQPDRPTALFCAQNFVTVGAARALHELGLEHEVAQVGFDDVGLADIVRPAITVVPQYPRSLGRQAARLLFDRIDGDDSPARREIVPVSLIERGSGELAPPD
ncbi:MAG: substrate-binding domain-containing protein [Acidimicrobiales bacterium]